MVKHTPAKFQVGQLVGIFPDAHPSHLSHGTLWVVKAVLESERRTAPYYHCRSVATGALRLFMHYELTAGAEPNGG